MCLPNSAHIIFFCPPGRMCLTNSKKASRQEALLRRQATLGVRRGLPSPNNPEDIADIVEAAEADRLDAKARHYFAILLQHPSPGSASWDDLDLSSEERWLLPSIYPREQPWTRFMPSRFVAWTRSNELIAIHSPVRAPGLRKWLSNGRTTAQQKAPEQHPEPRSS